ncbi:glycosyltransferase family protein [Actinomadura rubteroloni]|nr:glycosyltransferase [Actinomadura rubteroloni]
MDERGRDTGFAFVREPVRSEHRTVFCALAARHRMVGLCSCGPFPLYHEGFRDIWVDERRAPEDGWRSDFVAVCAAWCHCFREPGRFLPPNRPRLLFSNSDFTDIDRVRALGAPDGPPGKRWDVLYVCQPGHRAAVAKDWELAKACLRRLCAELGLRVLVVGRADVPDLPGLEVSAPVPWADYLGLVARSRMVLVPHRLDASPRALPEALALDVPVLVRAGLLGGWKYVGPATGAFFEDDGDVGDAAARLLGQDVAPAAWLAAHYGRERAERRLADFLRTLDADLPDERVRVAGRLGP